MRHIYNEKLPSCVLVESDTISFQYIEKLFSEIGEDAGNKMVTRATKNLSHALNLKLELSAPRRLRLINRILFLFSTCKLPMLEETQLMESLSSLLRNKRSHGTEVHLEWRPLLSRFLERHNLGGRYVPTNSAKVMNRHRRAMLEMMRESRAYFPKEAALEVWEQCSPRLSQTQGQDSFYALATLHLISPTRHDEYDKLMPLYMKAWARVERCPEWDLLWLSLLCRGRKHTRTFDWAVAEPQIFTSLQRALAVKIGDGAEAVTDRKAPTAPIKLFLANVDILTSRIVKLAKLATFCISRADICPRSNAMSYLVRLINLGRVYFYPSNNHACTTRLVAFINCFCKELAKSIGKQVAVSNDTLNVPLLKSTQVFLLIDLFLPLLQQGVFSENKGVSTASAASLRTLTFISPRQLSGPLIDFVHMSLGEGSTDSTHMFPAGVFLLSMLTQPLLTPLPLLAPALPSLMHLSLRGIDPNNQRKTIATLLMYKSLLHWLPISESQSASPTCNERDDFAAFDTELPLGEYERVVESIPAIGSALIGWAPEFLEKLLLMLLSQEAPAKSSNSPDQLLMGQQTSMLRDLLHLFFKRLDMETHQNCTTILMTFISSHVVLNAVKDVAFVVEACVAAHPNSLSEFMNLIGRDLALQDKLSPREITWRLHLLKGAFRYAGAQTLEHSQAILAILSATLPHANKEAAKAACKLLRSVLQGMSESYPLKGDSYAQFQSSNSTWCDFSIQWHECGVEEFKFAIELLQKHLLVPLDRLKDISSKSNPERDLREVLQCLRGGGGLIHELGNKGQRGGDDSVLDTGSCYGRLWMHDAKKSLLNLRRKIIVGLHDAWLLMGDDSCSIKQTKLWLKCAWVALSTRGSVGHQARDKVSSTSTGMRRFFVDPMRSAFGQAKFDLEVSLGNMKVDDAASHVLWSEGAMVPVHVKVLRIWAHFALRQDISPRLIVNKIRDEDKLNGVVNIGAMIGPHEALIGDILAAAIGKYSTVRALAQRALPWPTHTWLLRKELSGLIDSVAGNSYEHCAGAAFVLMDPRALRKIASDQELSHRLLLRICRSGVLVLALPVSDQDRVVELCFQLLIAFLGHWLEEFDLGMQHVFEQEFLHLLKIDTTETDSESRAAQNLSWRHELAACWCLLQAVMKAVPSMGTWARFLLCLRSGDGHPLQKLGLFALTRLISRHLDLISDKEPVALLLGNTNYIFNALVFNRRGGSRNLWSVGVEGLINEAMRTGAPRFPKSRLPLTSSTFKSKHARFAKYWFRMCGSGLFVSLEGVLVIQKRFDDADKRYFTCAIAEVLAGVMREASNVKMHYDEAILHQMWAFALPVLEAQMKDSSFDVSSDWADAVRFAVAKRSPLVMAPLVSVIVAHVEADLIDTTDRQDFTSHAKWLRLLQSVLAEWGHDAHTESSFCDIAESLLPLLLNAYVHSYEVTRVTIAKTLFLLFDFPCFSSCSRIQSLRCLTHTRILSLLSTSSSPSTERDVRILRRAQETTAHWLLTCALGGDSGVHHWRQVALICPLFRGLLDEDIDHQNFTRSILKYLSQSIDLFPETPSISNLFSHDSWKVREEALRYIGVLDARLNLSSACLIEHIIPLLSDSRSEVGEAARDVTSLIFLADLNTDHGVALIDRLMTSATRYLKKMGRQSKESNSDKELDKKRTQLGIDVRFSVQGLSALIMSSPFEVPAPVVPAIGMLARLASSGDLDALKSARYVFMEFKRTHLDDWEKHRVTFDEQTLDALNDTLEAPSYFC